MGEFSSEIIGLGRSLYRRAASEQVRRLFAPLLPRTHVCLRSLASLLDSILRPSTPMTRLCYGSFNPVRESRFAIRLQVC